MSLPIDAVLGEIARAARARRNIVIEASPGAGKTTRVPPVLEALGPVLVLEPRRLAARLAATRVASERGERVGGSVGYQIRFEDRTSARTRLTYVTEGVLTRRIMADPSIAGIDCVVLDEIHERHLHGDLALALLERLRRERPELVLVAMSATLDAAPIAALLDAVTIRCEGRAHEVAIEEQPLGRDDLDVAVAKAARRLARAEPEGHILAFLPGAAEIRRAAERCAALGRDEGMRILPLHGQLSPREQDEAVAPSRARKLVLATNVAESSITIEGVIGVVDSGLAKVARHRPGATLPELRLAPISQASARQRAGRAGRTGPGRCIRLYGDFARRPAFDEPEIARSDLSELRLGLALAGVLDPEALAWLTPPPREALDAAEALLAAIGALADGAPTEIGRALAALPLPPRLGRVLVEARARGVDGRAAVALALLESRPSDLWQAIERFEEARAARFEESAVAALGFDRRIHLVERARRQIARAAERLPPPGTAEDEDRDLEASFLAGFPDRVARVIGEERGGLKLAMSEGGGAFLADRAAVGPEGLTLALEAQQTAPGRPARIEQAAGISLDTVLDAGAARIVLEDELAVDDRGRLESVGRMRYGRLVLDESRARAAPSREGARLLLEAGRRRELFERDDLARLRERLRFAREEDPTLPALDDDALAAALEELAATITSLAELEALPLATLVAQAVAVDERALRRLAPASVRLTSGVELSVRYSGHGPPQVESYLQDFFGMAEGPRAGSRPLVVALWAPNRRPIQVTSDLASFWKNHYPELRRQLARRYPKHHWPDDPLGAPAKRLVRQL